MEVLPEEVIILIFKRLTLKELLNVSTVCKRFRQIALSPLFYTMVSAFVENEDKKLEDLKGFFRLVPYVKKLNLTIVGNPKFKDKSKVTKLRVATMFNNLECLNIEFRYCQKVVDFLPMSLKHLTVKYFKRFMDRSQLEILTEVVRCCPKIEYVNIVNYRPGVFPKYLYPIYNWKYFFHSVRHTLTTLHCDIKLFDDRNLSKVMAKCKKISSLVVFCDIDLTVSQAISPLIPFKRLRNLVLMKAYFEEGLDEKFDVRNLRQVTSLTLNIGWLRGPMFGKVFAAFPNLQRLYILDNTFEIENLADCLASGVAPKLTEISIEDLLLAQIMCSQFELLASVAKSRHPPINLYYHGQDNDHSVILNNYKPFNNYAECLLSSCCDWCTSRPIGCLYREPDAIEMV